MKAQNVKQKIFVVIIILFVIGMLAINYFTPYLADDYFYVKKSAAFSSINDFFRSIGDFYINGGGRVLGHIFANVFSILPPLVFDLLNTFCYFVVTFLIYLICKGDNKNSISLYIGIHVMIWLCVPDYGQVMFWMSGSSNYLWPSVPILLMLYIYRKYTLMQGEYVKSLIYILPLFVLGFLAGIAMENMSAGMVVIVTMHLLYYKKKRWKIHIPILAGYAGALLGFACLFFAPGNQVRAGMDTETTLSIPFKFFIISYYWVTFAGGLCIIWLVLYWLNRHRQKEVVSIPYVSGAIVSAYCMLAAPSSPERTWYIVCVFLIIAVGILYRSFEFDKSRLQHEIIAIICTGTVIFLCVAMADTVLYSREISVQTQIREKYILEQKENGNLDITTKVISHQYPFRAKHDGLTGLSDITSDADYWINQGIADYYGINSIMGVE